MKIEILGAGCAKCKTVERNVRQAVSELGVQADIRKVEDITEIMNFGVMVTPALFVNGESKAVGRVPSVDEIKNYLGEV